MFKFIKNLFKRAEPEEKELKTIPIEINGITFKEYCNKIVNNQWTEADNIQDFEDMIFLLTEMNGKSRKENAEVFYETVNKMGV